MRGVGCDPLDGHDGVFDGDEFGGEVVANRSVVDRRAADRRLFESAKSGDRVARLVHDFW